MQAAEARPQADNSDQEEVALAALAAEALQGGTHLLLPAPEEGVKKPRKKMMTPEEDTLILRTWVR